jgi:UDP-glucose 4-epimerase
MTLLVTGGTGFVMSMVAKAWLDRDANARVVILDRAQPDAQAAAHFAPVRERVTFLTADITEPATWTSQLDGHDITTIVHGATLTPNSRPSDPTKQPEAHDPGAIMDVNLMGTVHMLDWARQRPGIRRFVYVSSGSVYRHHGPDWSGEPLPEDGYVAPLTLYGISKFASEMVVSRYADLFGLSCVSTRLSSVYGPMDRVTTSRNVRHVPNRIAHMALAGEEIRPNSLEPVGDYVTSGDVARAILALIDAQTLRYRHYNIGSGVITTVGDFIEWARERVPSLVATVSPPESANMVLNPALKTGMWGVYDTARIERDTPWRPSDAKQAFHAYMDWIASHEISSS